MPKIEPIAFERLDITRLDEDDGDEKPKRQTRTRATVISQKALRGMFEKINGALAITGNRDLALHDVELDMLAESWHAVLKEYPQFGKLVARGNKITIWGDALLTTFIILEKRRGLLANTATGPTRHIFGNDRNGQNDPGTARRVV